MLQTPLAMLRRASRCPVLHELAAKMASTPQRLNAVEAGRVMVSDEFLSALAKAMGCPVAMVTGAYLEGRRARLKSEVREIEARLSSRRSNPGGGRQKTA